MFVLYSALVDSGIFELIMFPEVCVLGSDL